MKGLEKLTSIRLAEVLSQKGTIPTDKITDALYAQDKHGEPIAESLVGAGHISEWDLAKVVVESFQLPFITPGSYDIQKEARDKLPEEVLFEHQIVPLDVFGNLVTIAMPIMTSWDVLDKLQRKLDIEFFPYVGLIAENKKVIGELYPNYKKWQETRTAEKEKEKAKPQAKPQAGGDWANIFDAADAAVRSSMPRK